MDILDMSILMDVADMAKGMTKEEILNGFTLTMEDFSDEEEIFFNEFYNYGKAMGIRVVVNNLVESTKGRQGTAAAMAYLTLPGKDFFDGTLTSDKLASAIGHTGSAATRWSRATALKNEMYI